MNIKIVNWPINNVGGIVTLVVSLRDALRSLGHTVNVLHVSEAGRMRVRPDTDSECEIAGEFRSTRTSESFDKLMQELNSSDLVIFAHPSPHPTKDQLSKVGGGRNWQKIYRGLTTKSTVLIHDNMWDKTNDWFAEVSDHVTHIFCCQKLFTESMSRYPGLPKMTWSYHPMSNVPDDIPIDRNPNLMMHTQWVQWKKHKLLLPMLPKLPMKIDLFNSGIQYYYLRKEQMYKDYVTDHRSGAHGDAMVDERAIYLDSVPHSWIRSALQKNIGSVDFSTRGYVNYTHWEPLAHGAASFVHEDVLAQPTCCLPLDALVIPFNFDNFVDKTWDLLEMPKSERIERMLVGHKFVKENMSPVSVAKRLLEFVQ